MKLGVFTVLFQHLPFEEMLDHVKEHGLDAVEIGTGNYPGNAHCNPDLLLSDSNALRQWKKAIDDRGLILSALSCHGNPLHPNKEIAKDCHETFLKTVKLAQKLDLGVINLFSGCPGDHDGAKYPYWPAVAWPHDYTEVLEWQWNEKIIPYWKEWGDFAKRHGVKLAFEMHGGFSVHSPATLLRLRHAAGEIIGANFDPSHLYWQGIDPILAIRKLGNERAIFHFHAKDTVFDPTNLSSTGLLDTQNLENIRDRSWHFRTVGYGHDLKHWGDLLSALRLIGYDGVVSIEHEDALMSVEEGFRKGVANLKRVLFEEPMPEAWWS